MMDCSDDSSVNIELFGRPFRIDDLDSLNLKSGQGFEKDELAFVEKFVRPNDICIDIGANIGLFTVALARAAGIGGRVYSFEPDPDNFSVLSHNASIWRDVCDVRVYCLACGEANGKAILYKSTENRGMHRLYESPCCRGGNTEVTKAIVDEIVTEAVRLIKIDIEGYEPYAVLGLASTIARSPEIALLTEFSPISMIDADSSAASYIESLLGFGLFPHRMSGNQLIPIDVDELLVNCSVLNSGDFASMRTRCIDRTSSEIFEIATQYAAKLGFRGPIIENLVFIRRNESSVA